MREKIIAGNWKMNTTLADAYILAGGVLNEAEHFEEVKIILCPPSVWLGLVAEHLLAPRKNREIGLNKNIALGAQNMHFAEHGAFTGEISPGMVKEVADYVILGHSERTHIFKEDVDLIAQKVKSAFENDITPILCVGEDSKSDKSNRQLAHRLQHLIAGLTEDEVSRLIVAYEPVWAIGTGNAATPQYAEETCFVLRRVLGDDARILYGGSVDEINAKAFLEQEDIDGLLIGGTSLKLKPFLQICRIADDLIIAENTKKHFAQEKGVKHVVIESVDN